MMRIDRWSMSGVAGDQREAWYGDRTALRLSGFLGLGTELFLLMLCSVARRLDWYLVLNVTVMNAVWAVCVVYRRVVLLRKIDSELRTRNSEFN